jgi:polyisoprenoid-binding protein YceI
MSSGALHVPRAQWTGPARIGPLRLTASNTTVRFAIRFLRFVTIRGSFGDVEGELSYDESRPAATSLVARLPVSSLDTGNRLRDAHLRSSAWFDARQYSHIALHAVGAECAGHEMRVPSNVRIKGRETRVVMKCVTQRAGGASVALIGRFRLPRSPYGIGPPSYGVAPWDPRAYLVDDGVDVELRLRLDQ